MKLDEGQHITSPAADVFIADGALTGLSNNNNFNLLDGAGRTFDRSLND